jgi:predicted nucleotidyltransferase component of viral defense system
MISRADIAELAAEWGLREEVIEKDYVIGWLLWGIGLQMELKASWAFKGGTSLRKCFISTWRFSEDLDFTVLPGGPIKTDELTVIFATLLYRIYTETGIDFTVAKPVFKAFGAGDYVEGRVYYRGPRNDSRPARIKFDLLSSEKLVRPPSVRLISHPYSKYENSYPADAGILCYSFEEVFAEKIRAMSERCRPRDLYDIISIYQHRTKNNLNHAEVNDILLKKCSSKGVAPATLSLVETSPHKNELVGEWENMLSHQLKSLPKFNDFWQELPNLFLWLSGQG